MAIPFKPMSRFASEESEGRWQRVRCVASNPSHPENYLAGAILDLLEGLHDKATPAPANDVPAPPKVTPEDLELQAGQTWLTRSGDAVKLVESDHCDDDFPFKGDNHYWYTKTGRIYLSGGTRGADLVELVSDVEQAPKPDAAPSESLVERVARSIERTVDFNPDSYAPEARAAIREIATAARNAGLIAAATWLESEADYATWLESEADK
jgi:hypothetical protein